MVEPRQRKFILGVGAQRSGTTWLHNYLSNDKRFNPGFRKEYHVWDWVDLPEMSYAAAPKPNAWKKLRRKPEALRYRMQTSDDFYFEYFASLLNCSYELTGDITPSCCGLDERRFKFIKDGFEKRGISCRVVFFLRDPVSRIKSAFKYQIGRRNFREVGGTPDASFVDALRQYYPLDRVRFRTSYHDTIRKLERVFDQSDIYIGIFENMFDTVSIERLSGFIGIEARKAAAGTKVNTAEFKDKVSDDLDQEIREYYKDVYAYCFRRFPETKALWGA